MTEPATTRLETAARELLDQTQHASAISTTPPARVVLEDLSCSLGTMSMSVLGESLEWTLTIPSGGQARGYYAVHLDDSGLRLSQPGRPMGLTKLDWDTHLEEMRSLVTQAMRTQPGWSALRARIIDAERASRRSRLRDTLLNLLTDIDDLTIAEQWAAVAGEPDRAAAAVAESILTSGSFGGTAAELLATARAATQP